jgi:hypothetical protein
MIVQLSVEGDEPVEELAELSDWLNRESELRGLGGAGGGGPPAAHAGGLV